MNHFRHFFFSLFVVLCASATASDATLDSLLARILPQGDDAAKFSCTLEPATAEGSWFEVSADGQSVSVKASDRIAAATGINWYLHKAGIDIAWNNPTAKLPDVLPAATSGRRTAAVDYRYYLNFCTHSYTMAFWGWDRWQQEIDWMALHGINLPLIITGMESVWKAVLQDGYGYSSLDEVDEFVSGAAYYGWFFMNNLTAWGGPQPQSWYEQREALAKQIFRRLSEFGMKPVIPGYVGMIPGKFLSYAAADSVKNWTSADIVSSGSWCSFERPYFVKNTARLKEFAAKYYAAIDSIYGDVLSTHYYAIDPFHEGGVPSGVSDPGGSVKAMYEALTAYDSQAVWVAQHWQTNPTTYVTQNIPQGSLLILDLHGDSSGDTECSGNHTDAQNRNHNWVWGHTSNFGGNVGLFGRINRIIDCYYTALSKQASSRLSGIGTLPEGIENNNVLYDLIYSLPWTDRQITLDEFLGEYVTMRYGVTEESDADTYATLLDAWKRLAAGPYSCTSNGQQGTTESVFLMRPATSPGTVSTWANSSWYWDIDDVRTACYEFVSVAEKLKGNNNFEYDLVDVTRQALADYGKLVLDSISTQTSVTRFRTARRFLRLILDQDTLLGTRPEFRLGTWIERARALGKNEEEKALYEKNARMLLTTWGDRAQCENGGLHDYANREWNGLLASYYYPRWSAFVSKTFQSQSWFADYEWPFVTGATTGTNYSYLPDGASYAYGSFSAKPEGDAVETAVRLYRKYFQDFRPTVWEKFSPDTSHVYALTNAEKWYGETDTEGLNYTAPNSDYAGYRLKRSALDSTSLDFQWKFEASDATPGAFRMKNLGIAAAGASPYLCSTPSTSAYPAYTFTEEGTDFFVFCCGNVFYLKDAAADLYMAPDCAWAEACVLVSATKGATANLYLHDLTANLLVDGITQLPATTSPSAAAIYDLTGRRISKPALGLYVVDGRKVLRTE